MEVPTTIQTSALDGVVDALAAAGVTLVATLPDSRIGPVIDRIDRDHRLNHVPLTREDEGVGVCAGSWMAGGRPCLFVQNAGFLESVNDIVTLSLLAQIPLLMVIAYRGHLGEPHWYHSTAGRVTEGVMNVLGVRYQIVDDPAGVASAVARMALTTETQACPGAVLLTLRALGAVQ